MAERHDDNKNDQQERYEFHGGVLQRGGHLYDEAVETNKPQKFDSDDKNDKRQ